MNGTTGRSWRTTISGACTAAGTLILGGSLLAGINDVLPKSFIVGLLEAGIILQVLGVIFHSLFSADERELKNLKQQVNENTEAMSVLKGNTPPPFTTNETKKEDK